MASLLAIAQRANIPRQTARTCVKKGLLRAAPYDDTDVVLLRVAASCLRFRENSTFFDPPRLRGALLLTKAFLQDASLNSNAWLIFSAETTELIISADEAWTILNRSKEEVLALPIGAWAQRYLP